MTNLKQYIETAHVPIAEDVMLFIKNRNGTFPAHLLCVCQCLVYSFTIHLPYVACICWIVLFVTFSYTLVSSTLFSCPASATSYSGSLASQYC